MIVSFYNQLQSNASFWKNANFYFILFYFIFVIKPNLWNNCIVY
jgi:hypothetical protein